MKNKIKILITILCFSITFLVGCNIENKLLQNGLEITSLLEEMVKSDSYFKLYANSFTTETQRKKFIASDYDTPIKIYSISEPDNNLAIKEELEKDTSLKENWDKLSDELKEQLTNRNSLFSIINTINFSNPDLNYASITHIYYAEKVFSNCKIQKSICYLYTFETGTPIAVIFTPLNNKIKATGYFLITEKTKTLSEIRNLFEPYKCEVKVVFEK